MKIKDVLTESTILDKKELLQDFLRFCQEALELDSLPPIKLLPSTDYSVQHKSFGGYNPEKKNIVTAIANRHPVDVMRTLAHELVHYKQDLNGQLNDNSGATGSDEENEANSVAGIIMRNFGQSHPEVFE